MAYVINRFNGAQLVILEDGTIDTSTSVSLVGRNYTGYGEIQNENFVFLLENFANPSAPARPVSGQIWYNSQNSTLNVYDGVAWKAVGSAVVADIVSRPAGSEGDFFVDKDTDQLYAFSNGWFLVGPEAVGNFGVTKIRARSVLDTAGISHAVLEIVNDNSIIGIVSSDGFAIAVTDFIDGFSTLTPGITLNSTTVAGENIYQYTGRLAGNATTATRLATPKKINGVNFDGQVDITILANTNATLSRGTYLTGANFNGSAATSWSVDATPTNIIGKVVARDSAGNFSAGVVTGDLIGNVTGNVTAAAGTSTFNIITANQFVGATLTGNAFTASKLQTARTINTVLFDGTANITVSAESVTLTGNTLAANVVFSSLTSVGQLSGLNVANDGITLGNSLGFKAFLSASTEDPVLASQTAGKSLKFKVADSAYPGSTAEIQFSPGDIGLSLGGTNTPCLLSDRDIAINLGHVNYRWKNVHSQFFVGTATTAQYADLAENYTADCYYAPGTVLMFGGAAEVTIADAASRRIAGIVSENPAYLMNSQLTGTYVVPVALQGRVLCSVKGPVKKGDMLISAGHGHAVVSNDPAMGSVIGKSLADFDGVEGIIEVVVGRL